MPEEFPAPFTDDYVVEKYPPFTVFLINKGMSLQLPQSMECVGYRQHGVPQDLLQEKGKPSVKGFSV